MRWPAARITAPNRRVKPRIGLFVAAELLLAMAIPFLAISGYHALLASNTGTFVDAPTIEEPGWSALVSATSVIGVVEMADGAVTGATLIVAAGATTSAGDSSSDAAGTVLLVPGDLAVTVAVEPDEPAAASTDGVAPAVPLAELAPSEAGDALSRAVNLDLTATYVVDEATWPEVLGSSTYRLDNPDPVPAGPVADVTTTDQTTDASLAFAVGSVTVDGTNAGPFVGRPVRGASLSSMMVRRHQLWSAMIAEPPEGDHAVADALRSIGLAGAAQVIELPTATEAEGVQADAVKAEELLREIVAFPSGARLEVRLVDRSGRVELTAVAAAFAGRGIEVVEIANAVQFDAGSTEIIRPTVLGEGAEQLDALADDLGLVPLVDPEQEHDTVTVLIGEDFDATVIG